MENEDQLAKYLFQLKKLRRDRNKERGDAPHKVVLLLAIIEGVENGDIISNRISVTPELVLSFKSIWSKIVVTDHLQNFAMPFFRLKSDGFWKLHSKHGSFIPRIISTFIGLREAISCAEMDKVLFSFLLNPISREVIKSELLNHYFADTKDRLTNAENDFVNELTTQVLNNDRITYAERIAELRIKMQVSDFEEEIYVRSGIFKREIPKIYNYTCAISGLRIESTINAQLVDACHITPFSISQDDTAGNGFSLTPTIHRAYDRGLITIDEDYLVRISPNITEVDSVYSLKQFDGKKILLPVKKCFYPLQENFGWHRRECFLG
ncbi:HNH endonuclease [Brumimicrobium glaciale]|uniref:HNH endonuclease n=1 Tax=Brumimicrobium glaciale TaxID=200475 RepID=A0A4Q4KIA4_9FLAO|nr:HNH endonuclease [Brumimicrobium glaciale]RYM32885.1 HNH endonuclease [Brumimicrobium glaciale]